MSTQTSRGHTRPVQTTFLRTYKLRPKEKDPVIDAVHTVINRSGLSMKELHEKSGVSKSTHSNWFDGDTMKPQFATLVATLRAMGYEFQITPVRHAVNGKATRAEAPAIVWAK